MRQFTDDMQGLRLLMADELDLVAGGNGQDTDDTTVEGITVWGENPADVGSGWFVFDLLGWGGFGSLNDCAPQSGGATSQANSYASGKMSFTGDLNDPLDLKAYTAAHNALAALYTFGTNNPTAVIAEANGATMTGAQLMAQLSNTVINIMSSATYPGATTYAPDGADTYYGTPLGNQIYIDPQNYNVWGDAATLGNDANYNYIVFHEIAHAMTDAYNQGVANPSQREAIANRVGMNLAAAVGFAYPSAPRGGLAPN